MACLWSYLGYCHLRLVGRQSLTPGLLAVCSPPRSTRIPYVRMRPGAKPDPLTLLKAAGSRAEREALDDAAVAAAPGPSGGCFPLPAVKDVRGKRNSGSCPAGPLRHLSLYSICPACNNSAGLPPPLSTEQIDSFERNVMEFVKPNHGTTTLGFIFQARARPGQSQRWAVAGMQLRS